MWCNKMWIILYCSVDGNNPTRLGKCTRDYHVTSQTIMQAPQPIGNCTQARLYLSPVLRRHLPYAPADPGGNPAMAPIRSLNRTWPLSRQIFLPHKNGTHPSFCLFCLLSTSLNFRTHNNWQYSHHWPSIYMYNHLLWIFPCIFSVYDLLHAIWSLTPFPLNCLNEIKRPR